MAGPTPAGSLPPRSAASRLLEPDAFLWATGIEDTFVTDPHAKTGRTLDEYELTGHYDRLEGDLDRIAALGVSCARYGLPWYRIEPQRGRWDWSFADRALDGLLERGVSPIVDLVHYGTPAWLAGGFLDPDYPRAVAEYAAAVALRFKGRVRWYTPLNEPRITAYYCGKLGHWPPYARGWGGFVRLMLALCRGIVMTEAALRAVDREIVTVHVDATDLYEPSEPHHVAEAGRRQSLVYLALDLVTGRVDAAHPLAEWLLKNGAKGQDLAWFRAHPAEPDVVGLNLYPMFSRKVSVRAKPPLTPAPSPPEGRGGIRFRMPYAGDPGLVETIGRAYWERYRRPVMVTETAAASSLRRRAAWLAASVEGCRRLREAGVPMVGYTWWPTYALVAWSYRGSAHPIDRYVVPMGLYDLAPDLERIETPLVGAYRAHATSGAPGRFAEVPRGM